MPGISNALLGLVLTAALSWAVSPAGAETGEIRIAKQYGLAYLPLMIMKKQGLYEKHASELGIDTKASYKTLGSNTLANESLISGNIDVITNGPPGFLIFWNRTKGTPSEVKGIAPLLSQSMWLNTRDPNVKSVRDLTEKDRIAVTAVKSSVPAILLQMAAANEFGDAEYEHFDPLTVSLSHPDGMNMLLSGKAEITAHFTSPPYQNIEANTPGIHTILTTEQVLGGPATFNLLLTTTKFEKENPKAVEALVDALKDAQSFISENKDKAAEIYLEMSNSRNTSKESIVKLLDDPGTVYTVTPQKFLTYADFLHRIGTIKEAPADWKELFFPYVYDQPGN